MDIDPTPAHQPHDDDAPAPLGRRHLLGAGLGGAAAALLPVLAGRAGAARPATTPPTEPAPTTTVAPPLQPTDADVELLVFAEGVELAARDLYDIALASVEFSDVQRTVVATLRESHEAYFQSLAAILGRRGSGQANADVVSALRGGFTGDAAKVLGSMYDLESTAVATHTEILGELDGLDGAKLIASILIVEARHGTVLADLAGRDSLDDLLVATEADALAPAEG